MAGNQSERYENSDEFFRLSGSAWMRMTPTAATDVCRAALGNGLLVWRIEGGVWRDPNFEARGDCIWDGINPPAGMDAVALNNQQAAEYILLQSKSHDVFIVTTTQYERTTKGGGGS